MTGLNKKSFASLHHRIEQGIARGETTDQISTSLGVPIADVIQARHHMDLLASDDEDTDTTPVVPVARPHGNFSPTLPEYDAQPVANTPGFHALAEAMRLEQARIYGALQREHRQTHIPAVCDDDADIVDLGQARTHRRSA